MTAPTTSTATASRGSAAAPATDRAERRDLGAAPWRLEDTLWLLVAVVATAAVFARSLPGEFVYDDLLLIQRNPLIAELANVPTLLTRSYWEFLDPGDATQIGYWRPLSAIGHAVGWALGGGEPLAFHALCVAFHSAATATAFLIVRRLSGTTWVAGTSALLFGLHPLHVESVAWISAMNDPLVGSFSLLSVLFYLRWRQRGSHGLPIAGALLFFLALLAKEMGVAVLPLCVAIDIGRNRNANEGPGADAWFGGLRDAPRAYLPMAVVIAVWIGCRMLVFGSVFAGFDRTPTHFGVGAERMAMLRVELWGGSLALLAWPMELNAFRRFRPFLEWTDPDIVVALIASAASALVLAFAWLRKARLATCAFLLIPFGFVPVLVNVGSLGRFPLSDRFLYVPVIGFAFLLALALRRALPKSVAIAAMLVVGALYGVKSWNRIDVWKDEETLFRNAVAESPRSAYLHWGLARVLLGKLVADPDDDATMQEAFEIIERSGELLIDAKEPDTDIYVTSEDYLQTNLALGMWYTLEARREGFGYGTAIAIFEDLARSVGEVMDKTREARELGIRVVDPNLDLDLVYANLGAAQRLAGNLAEAEIALKKALSLDPRCVEAHNEMSRVAAQLGQWNVAAHHAEKSLELQPGDYQSKLLLAQALREWGKRDRAEALALELVEKDPTKPQAMLILAANRLEARKEREAMVWIDRALDADPTSGHAWYFKARAMQALDVNPQATIDAYRRATELDPESFEAAYSFAYVLLSTNAHAAAIPYMIRAYRLAGDEAKLGILYTALNDMPFESADQLFELATIDVRRGRRELAESWLNRALELDPNHAGALFDKGRLLRMQERHEEALTLMRRSLEIEPDAFVNATEFAQYLMTRGLLVEAQALLERARGLTKPAEWNDDEFESGQRLIEKLLDKIAEDLPSSDAIGPTAPRRD